jgi:hypothetical protein
MEAPDVIGFILDEALFVIREKGFIIDSIITTKPVKATEPLGIARVLRIRFINDGKLQVIVAYQDYEKGGVQYEI